MFERVIIAKSSGRIDRVLQDSRVGEWIWMSRKSWDELFQQKCIKSGNGKVFRSSDQVKVDEKIFVCLPVTNLGLQSPDNIVQEEILHYLAPDRSFAIVKKPAAWPSYSLFPWEKNSFCNLVADIFQKENIISKQEFIKLGKAPTLEAGFVQRLDFGTSGLMLVALTEEMKNLFRKLIKEKKFLKTYYAIVRGNTTFNIKTKSYQILLTPSAKIVKVVEEEGLPITVSIETLANGKGSSLVKCSTSEGIRHQVRAILSSEGHPLVADALYGDNNETFPHYFLHAYSLQLQESIPTLKIFNSEIICPPPMIFLDALKKLEIP